MECWRLLDPDIVLFVAMSGDTSWTLTAWNVTNSPEPSVLEHRYGSFRVKNALERWLSSGVKGTKMKEVKDERTVGFWGPGGNGRERCEGQEGVQMNQG